MADTGAPWNLPYPLPTDLVRDGADAIKDLAEATADGLSATGGLVAVKSAIFTGTQTNSTASGANFAVTDLTLTHEVADAANNLILVAQLSQVGSSIGLGFVGAAFHDGTDLINVGAAAGARVRTGVGYASPTASNFETKSLALYNVYTPGAGSKTYTVRVINLRTDGTRTLYVNRTVRDSSDDGRGASTFTLMEVKV